MKKRLMNEGGNIMIIALIITACIAMITGYQISRLVTEYRLSSKSYHQSVALHLAEAGIERAIWEINYADPAWASWSDDGSGNKNITENSFTDGNGQVIGEYSVGVTKMTGLSGSTPTIVSSGVAAADSGSIQAQQNIKVVLLGMGVSVFSWSVFGKDGVILDSSSITNSYDSRNGAYGGANVGTKGDVGTNAITSGAITLRNSATVAGDATVGPKGDIIEAIDVGAGAVITGTQEAAEEEIIFPPVVGPTGLPNKGDLIISPGGTDTINGDGQYSTINLKNNTLLTITADSIVYVTGSIDLGNGANIDINPGVSVVFYTDGGLNCDNSSSFNNLSQDPTSLIIYATDLYTGIMEFKNSSDFYGAIFAPQADIRVKNGATIYGSVCGKNVDVYNGGIIHYDEALGDGNDGLTTLPAIYKVISWQED